MTGVRRHTIIGNSAAALAAIRAIRGSGDWRPITLISAEKCPAYSPVLTPYYIEERIDRSHLFLVDERFYAKHRVETILGRSVAAVDPINRRLYLDDDSGRDYDDLLIATGASARDLQGVAPEARPFVTTLRTLSDAEKIRSAGQRARKMVVTGAGLVSLQTIKAMAGKGIDITLVSRSDQVLSQQMDRDGAGIIQEKLAGQGVGVLLGRDVSRVYVRGGRAQVVTSYGETLPADLVVVGKGVAPNIGMVAGTAIRTREGIVVDDRMRTSVENVFAAGDAAEGQNEITGKSEVIATWFNACAQGEIAGRNMAGRPARRRGQFRENVTTLMGVVVVSIGESKPPYGRYRVLEHRDRGRGRLRRLYLEGTRVVGALLVGSAEDAGVIRHCIAGKVDISAWMSTIAEAPLNFGDLLCGGRSHWPGYRN